MSDGEARFEYSKARSNMLSLLEGLKRAASGDVQKRATAKIERQISAVVRSKIEAHKASGDAEKETKVTSGDDAVTVSAPHYLGYHEWWPFRGRRMPPFIINRASKIFAAELEAAIKGEPSPLYVEEQQAEAKAAKREARAAKAAERFKRQIAAIYRRSDEYKAKKKAEAKARAKARRAAKKAAKGAS